MATRPRFFRTESDFRAWLEKNHARANEIMLGFYKVAANKKGITHRQALDQALCFGWIDGVAGSLGEEAWTVRFTPRKPKSYWSNVNIKRAGELIKSGRMRPSGLEAFKRRDPKGTRVYSSEQKTIRLDRASGAEFKRNRAAWQFFQSQPPSYKKVATWWVVSAKKEETRAKRLKQLIAVSKDRTRLPMLTSPTRRKKPIKS